MAMARFSPKLMEHGSVALRYGNGIGMAGVLSQGERMLYLPYGLIRVAQEPQGMGPIGGTKDAVVESIARDARAMGSG